MSVVGRLFGQVPRPPAPPEPVDVAARDADARAQAAQTAAAEAAERRKRRRLSALGDWSRPEAGALEPRRSMLASPPPDPLDR